MSTAEFVEAAISLVTPLLLSSRMSPPVAASVEGGDERPPARPPRALARGSPFPADVLRDGGVRDMGIPASSDVFLEPHELAAGNSFSKSRMLRMSAPASRRSIARRRQRAGRLPCLLPRSLITGLGALGAWYLLLREYDVRATRDRFRSSRRRQEPIAPVPVHQAPRSKHGNVVVVGDDDQSIYGWRGAASATFSISRRSSRRERRAVEKLRSTPDILHVANAAITRTSAGKEDPARHARRRASR